MTNFKDIYIEGYDMSKLEHIPVVSSYNSNYYSDDGRLLYAHSDDDNTTEWYLCITNYHRFDYIGYTHTSDGDKYLYKGANT